MSYPTSGQQAFQGYVSVGGVAFPVTGNTLEMARAPIYPDTIHGGVAARETSLMNFAYGRKSYSGSLDFPLFATVWATIKDWAVTTRGAKSVVSKKGPTIFTYANTYCPSMRLTKGPGEADTVGVSLDLVAKGRTATGAAPTFLATTGATLNQSPTPAWRGILTPTGYWSALVSNIISWSVTVTNNHVILYGGSATQDPEWIQAGRMDVAWEFTVYPAGVLEGLVDTWIDTQTTPTFGGFTISLDGGSTTHLTVPIANIDAFPENLGSVNEKVMRALSGRGVGDGTNGAIY